MQLSIENDKCRFNKIHNGTQNVFFATLDNMWIYGQEHNVTINGKVYYLYVAKFRVEGEGDPTPEMTFSSVVI